MKTGVGRPRSGALKVLLLGVAAAAFLTGHAGGAARSSGPARACYDCHQESRKEFDKKYVHPAVAKEDCMACHGSHGFQQ